MAELENPRSENTYQLILTNVDFFQRLDSCALFCASETKKNEVITALRWIFMSLKAKSNVWHRLFNWTKGEKNSL